LIGLQKPADFPKKEREEGPKRETSGEDTE